MLQMVLWQFPSANSLLYFSVKVITSYSKLSFEILVGMFFLTSINFFSNIFSKVTIVVDVVLLF